MFFLSDEIPINSLNGIILTNEGTYYLLNELVYKDGVYITKENPSMKDKIGTQINQFFGNIKQIDTLGYADNETTPKNTSVFLCVSIVDGIGYAKTILSKLPSFANYDLLEIVGVQYHGYTTIDNYYCLNFTNKIYKHVNAGTLVNFTHTQNCVDFFINGAEFTPDLEISIRHTIRTIAKQVSIKGANYLETNIKNRDLKFSPIIAKNVSMGTSEYFGNIAPYGIVAKALNLLNLNITKIRNWLIEHQRYGLWGYHTGTINTSIISSGTNDPVEVDAIDSTLVFEGLFNQSSISLLEMYRQSSGGYLAQLNDTGGPYSMNSSKENWFWCQEDYGVSASAFYFLDNISLSNSSTLDYLKTHFDNRSSMWIANPYYIEFLTARALKNHNGTEIFLQNITQKILNEKNADGTWGYYDKELSTAFAILTLSTLNYTGIELDRGILRLIEMQQEEGNWNSSTIFFSALDRGTNGLGKSIEINGNYFDYILYEDIDPIITTSYCVIALNQLPQTYSLCYNNQSLGSQFVSVSSYIEHVLNIYVT